MGNYYVFNEKNKKKFINSKSWIKTALSGCNGKIIHGSGYVLFDDAVLWNKLYRMDFFRSLEIQIHGEMATAPDVPVVWCAFLSANKISVTDKTVINYRIGRRGQHTGAKDHRFFACFELFRYFFEFTENKSWAESMESYFLHLQLSRYLWGYEKTPSESRNEFFEKICSAFKQRHYTKKSKISYPPLKNKSLPEFIRILLLKILHPLALKAIVKQNKWQFDLVVFIRKILENCFLVLQFMKNVR